MATKTATKSTIKKSGTATKKATKSTAKKATKAVTKKKLVPLKDAPTPKKNLVPLKDKPTPKKEDLEPIRDRYVPMKEYKPTGSSAANAATLGGRQKFNKSKYPMGAATRYANALKKIYK